MTAPPRVASRHAETPLQMPTGGQAIRALSRALRLRCPNCGRGWVLTRWGAVRDRCAACGLRYERTDDSYFSGAVFFGLLMGEALFAVTLLVVVLVMWPHVPWDRLTYGIPLGMGLIVPFLLPFSKVAWLGVDVLVRPVVAEELHERAVGSSRANA